MPDDPTVAAPRPSPAARLLVLPLRFYQRFVGPLIPPSCRFTPSCSEYAIQALRTHGALYGAWLTVRRLLRCAPWHPGGWDPVPPRRPGRRSPAQTPRATETLAEEN
jgi:putative membrane protein insertion efficiency factor